jgi:hypothetical protein
MTDKLQGEVAFASTRAMTYRRDKFFFVFHLQKFQNNE